MPRRVVAGELVINNVGLTAVANSITMDTGEPEVTVTGQQGDIVIGEDFSTAIGMIGAEFVSSADNIAFFREVKKSANIGTNVVVLLPTDGSREYTLNEATMTNKLNATLSSDGTFAVEFSGKPIL